jgi:hypothetical protein
LEIKLIDSSFVGGKFYEKPKLKSIFYTIKTMSGCYANRNINLFQLSDNSHYLDRREGAVFYNLLSVSFFIFAKMLKI